ncbi:MAG: hypothetical protein HYU68_10625 [Bacteroidetes bacterium]|nr:hypothetical protein [Bacteroidota bacterium]
MTITKANFQMNKPDFVLMLIDKSANAYGKLLGLNNSTRLEITLTIIQETVSNIMDIDISLLCSEKLIKEKLKQNLINYDQVRFVIYLLLADADILIQLKQTQFALKKYKIILLLTQWQTQQEVLKNYFEKQLEITELKERIETLKAEDKSYKRTA